MNQIEGGTKSMKKMQLKNKNSMKMFSVEARENNLHFIEILGKINCECKIEK